VSDDPRVGTELAGYRIVSLLGLVRLVARTDVTTRSLLPEQGESRDNPR
jgi:hypothetical protein